jgi:hypothetical protein
MSLEGNLTAFGLSEILQLIAVQQKSGMLSITSQDRAKVLFFRDGHIMSTRDRRRESKDPLKDYLTRYGILSREDLIRLTQISAQAKLDLTEIIVSEGILTEEQMRTHFRNHIQEELHEMLTWDQLSYKFLPGLDIIAGIKTWGDFNIEGMLMESMRRIDEFPAALKLLPDPSARISRVGDPKENQELSSNESAVRALLEKERTLDHLIAHAKMPQYETYEAVRHLHEKGLVAIQLDESLKATQAETTKRPKAKRVRRRTNVLPVAAAVLLFLGACAWSVNRAIPQLRDFLAGGKAGATESSITRNRVEFALKWRLEAYFATHGRYPNELSELAEAGLADKALLGRIASHGIRYHLTENGQRYTLL